MGLEHLVQYFEVVDISVDTKALIVLKIHIQVNFVEFFLFYIGPVQNPFGPVKNWDTGPLGPVEKILNITP